MLAPALTWELALGRAPELHCIATACNGVDRLVDRYLLTSWSIYFYKYEASLRVGDTELQITPGSVGIVPPGVEHEYEYRGRSEHLFAHFDVRPQAGEPVQVAALQELGRDFTSLAERFEHAVHVFRARPAQAEARLWDVLWELAERSSRQQLRHSRRAPAVERACRVIQARISEPLSLADLAEPAGVSPAHLTRLFRADLGVTATDYLRRCRLERALHLLTRSEVPIKEVACEVGIPDLHAFNKAVRRGYGLSPRSLRARGAAPNELPSTTLAPPAVDADEDAAAAPRSA
jgi:AraC family transcriptional regulator